MNKAITSNKFVTDLWSTLQMFIDEAVLAEREACADLLEHGYIDDEGHRFQYAKEIRARGQA